MISVNTIANHKALGFISGRMKIKTPLMTNPLETETIKALLSFYIA